MAVNVAALEATLDADVRGFMRGMKKADRQLDSTERSASRFASNIGSGIATLAKWGAAAGAAAGVASFALGKKAVDAAADLNESINAVEVVFGDAAGTIKSFGETAIEEVGLAQVKVNQAATVLGSSLKNAGFSADQAADATVGLTKRAADMASVFNTDVNTALDAIQAAIRGEIDPIEKFGVGMNAAQVEAKALELGLHSGTGEMSAQAKTAARLAVIMEQTAVVQGDYVNTSDSVANSQKRLKERVGELMAELGQRLLPVAEDVIGFLETTGVNAVRNLGNWIIDHLVPAIQSFTDFVQGSVVPAARTFVGWFRDEITPRVQAFADIMRDNWPDIERIFESLGQIVVDVGGIFTDTITGMARDSSQGGRSVAESMAIIIDAVADTLEAAARWVRFFREAFRAVRRYITPDLQSVSTFVTNWGQGLVEIAGRIGRDLLLGMLRGIRNMVPAIISELDDVGQRMMDAVRSKLGIRSPSTVFAEFGADTIRGFIQGVEDEETTLDQIIRDVFEKAVSGAQDVLSGLGAITGRGQAQSAVAEAEAALAGVQSRKQNLPQQIAEAKKALKVAQDAAKLVTPSEQLKILRARERVARTEEELRAAREEGNATALEMAILEAELVEAQDELTRAKRDAKGPTDDVRAAEDRLNDLLEEQAQIDAKLRDAQDELTRAKRDAISAEIRLVQAGQSLLDQGPESVEMFRQMAVRAGLSADEVNRMVEQARGLTGEIKVGGASRQDLIEDLETVRQKARDAAAAVGGGGGGGSGGGGGLAGAIAGLPEDFTLDFLVDTSQAERALAEIRRQLRDLETSTGLNIADVTVGGIRGGLVMHQGGTVPGPRGADVPIIAQAGEHITPVGGTPPGGGDIIVQVNGFMGSKEDIVRAVQKGLQAENRRSGRTRITGR